MSADVEDAVARRTLRDLSRVRRRIVDDRVALASRRTTVRTDDRRSRCALWHLESLLI